jgi:DNA-binding GntR family transcriptional regulator
MGLVQRMPRKGAVVFRPTFSEIRALYVATVFGLT